MAALLHPLRSGDRETVHAVFAGLGELSRRRRFLAAMPRLPRAAAEALAAVDGRRHVAYVARTEAGEPVGIGRYVVTRPGRAEIALEVVDAWQRRGVGTALLRRLADHARADGVTTFEAYVSGTNPAVRRLLARELDEVTGVVDDGVVELSGRVPAVPAVASA